MSGKASERYHNRVASRYDAVYDDAYWQFHDEITWRTVKPHLPRDLAVRCLDLGCGTGKWGLKIRKSGFGVTFIDHAPAMVGEVRQKIAGDEKCDAEVGDIVSLPMLGDAAFGLTLAMGDPLSICNNPAAAAREMFRVSKPGGVVIATADNRAAALGAYLERGDISGLERLIKRGKTHWVTADKAEQFELTTFTPAGLTRLFEKAGFDVLRVTGKPILPVRDIRDRLGDRTLFNKLVKLEMTLQQDPSLAASAGHLQITARRPDPVV